MSEDLRTAIGALCARPHGETGWKYWDDGTRRWYAVGLRELEILGAMIRSNMRDAYSHWCSTHAGVEL